MGLCGESTGCNCTLTSTTLTITGDGKAASPWAVNSPAIASYATFAALPNPAAMPNGTVFTVDEAYVQVVVVGGKYVIPGQHFYQVTGTTTAFTANSGNIEVAFNATSVFPRAPFTTSGGIRMRSYFHSAMLTLYAFGLHGKAATTKVNQIKVSGGSEPVPRYFVTEQQRWDDDADGNLTVPIGRSYTTGLSGAPIRPVVISTADISFAYSITAGGGQITQPQILHIGLNWNKLP